MLYYIMVLGRVIDFLQTTGLSGQGINRGLNMLRYSLVRGVSRVLSADRVNIASRYLGYCVNVFCVSYTVILLYHHAYIFMELLVLKACTSLVGGIQIRFLVSVPLPFLFGNVSCCRARLKLTPNKLGLNYEEKNRF